MALHDVAKVAGYDINLLPERIRNKIVVVGECWIWIGSHIRDYGQAYWKGKQVLSHRLVYTLLVGSIRKGLTLDHRYPDCNNRACCYPGHLDPVTHAENMHRGVHARKTVCKNGHPYTEENTYRSRTSRQCRACHRKVNANWRAKTIRDSKGRKVGVR